MLKPPKHAKKKIGVHVFDRAGFSSKYKSISSHEPDEASGSHFSHPDGEK
jgi:hypothetical protein